MAALTFLVIATLIITGVFVGYHAWDDWLHEKPEKGDKHSEPTEFETFQLESSLTITPQKIDRVTLIA